LRQLRRRLLPRTSPQQGGRQEGGHQPP
jgi:hypothetical protein